jgi:hypothetical protein
MHYNKIKEYPNFIDKELSKDLINYLNTNDGQDQNWGSVCFPWHWKKISGGRVGQPKLTIGIEEDTILKLKSKIQDILQLSYGDLDLQAMKGHRQPIACSTAPNAYFNVAAILCLNDDYVGGELIMPQHDISIKPNANSLYVFEEGENDLYGVAKIISGIRYSITSTWTFSGVDFEMFMWKDRKKR